MLCMWHKLQQSSPKVVSLGVQVALGHLGIWEKSYTLKAPTSMFCSLWPHLSSTCQAKPSCKIFFFSSALGLLGLQLVPSYSLDAR